VNVSKYAAGCGLIAHILFAGFVEEVGLYFKGTDVFLNPITEGGGIKTKLVEALGYGLNAVSTAQGAIGIDPALCNGKLAISGNADWAGFAEHVIRVSANQESVLPAYFEHFYWGNSTKMAAAFIQ